MTVEEGTDAANATGQEGNGIAGTGFKTPEELAAGYLNLEKKLGEQGNELGALRKDKETLSGHAETLATLLKENLTNGKQAAPKGEAATTDYGRELAAAKKELKDLDPVDEEYSGRHAELVDRIANLAAAAQHEKTLKAAGEMFKGELSERDAKAAQQRFHDENPTFNTPEMQARIRDFIAGDRTGMHDPMSAFFQIQRDDIAAASQAENDRLAAENAEYKKRLNLADGTDKTGKVIVRGQSPGQSQTKQPKATGKDLDAGMQAALAKSRGE